ncbi:tetratricopeptide repeat protein [Novosphingobium rosa]|uniref:tetratricopeptide repeat protein n=1 Tax=Novosphingobium rosa TaxID=76978 RepID=UPI00082BFEAB|nr:tetratricopeptide repeat protein [Novosphingobium rosa]
MMASARVLIAIACLAGWATPALADDREVLAQSEAALKEQRIDRVLTATAALLVEQEHRNADSDHLYFCAHSSPESLLYAGIGASQKKAATVLGGETCDALFLRAYALSDLGRRGEARDLLKRLTGMAPFYPHYLLEYAFALRQGGATEEALAAYRRAAELCGKGGFSRNETGDHATALRGIGFIQTEKGDLAGAEASYRASQTYDPANPLAANELRYIAGLRAGHARQPEQTVEHGSAPPPLVEGKAAQPAVP